MEFRDAIDALRQAGELVEVDRPVDIRYVGTLVEETDKALLFTNIVGYDMPFIAGIMNSRERMALAYGCEFSEIQAMLGKGAENPIPYVHVNSGPAREVCYQKDDEVDLYSLPVPLFAHLDGGPMITAGVIVARDGPDVLNSGVYRLMIRERNLTGIDLVTPNDLRRIAEANTLQGKPTPISISIGTSPAVTLATSYRPPAGVDELEIAGGIMGVPVKMTACETIDVPCIADAEIVMEAEILPTGWTKPEGRFGEFTRIMGAIHWNPHVRIKAIYTRKDPIYWGLHMPWEVVWLSAAIQEASLRRSLREANVNVSAINITPGGSCYFHAIIAIKARVGDGKTTAMAALAGDDFKHVIVVDDDIDIFDPLEVEWAVATRVQADKDVIIASGMRCKPLDPSLTLVTGRMPTTGKMGIDATIAPDLPRSRFQRINYAFETEVDVKSYLGDGDGTVDAAEDADLDALANEIRALVAETPTYYSELLKHFWKHGFQTVARALGRLHESGDLWQDEEGKICLTDSPFAAVPPGSKITNRS
jgi:2,5-furandicarboxylate decarboxylase 1